ncbi:MAG: amidohydrolase family protein [Mucinivorans sp.]
MRKIACPYVLNENGVLQESLVVSFDENGVVLAVEPVDRSTLDATPSLEYYDGILIPGMTNAHCHLELSYLKGQIAEGSMLDGFVRSITQIRGQWTVDEQVQAAKLNDHFMWSEGVQAVGDISNGTASFPAKVDSRIKYYTFAEYFNMPPDDQAEAYFAEKTANVAPARELGLAISPSPHSTYMVSDKLFKMSAGSERLSIHFMETATEMELFDKAGGMYRLMVDEWGMKPDFLYYGSHPARLVGSLPSDVPLLLIHNTQCKRADIEQVIAHFTNVTFVLCPRSNYYIERAFPPAELMYQMGVRVALGTDSLTSNHSLSMVEEIKWLSQNNPHIPLSAILSWATAGGARALGFEQELGSFTVGKRAGAVLLENIDFNTLKTTNQTTSRRLI